MQNGSIEHWRNSIRGVEFKTLTKEGEVRNPTFKEEFVQVIKEFKIPIERGFTDTISEECFSNTSYMARVHSYLIIMYKYAGKEIDIIIENFTNNAVYAFIIEDIIATTVKYFHWNQNCILFLNRGATAILYMEIWKRFLTERNESFRIKDEIWFLRAINPLLSSRNWKNRSLQKQRDPKTTMKNQNQHRKNLQKENSRYPLQRETKKVRSQAKRKLFCQQKGTCNES